MGYFTWTLANKDIQETKYGYASSCKLGYGYRGYIALPKEASKLYDDVVFNKEGYPFIQENYYDGYGMFGEHDAYDVIVDINRGYLSDLFSKTLKSRWEYFKPLAEMFDKGLEETEEFTSLLNDIIQSDFIKKEWKRHLGITIACCLEDNERLHFPLKITSTKNCRYEELTPSDSTQ